MDRLTTRVGLGLGHNALRAVAVRRSRIVWVAETPLEPEADLGPAIESLLRLAPVPRFPRPILSAAIGPHASQLKALAGLPDVADAGTLAALIRENAGSFFLKNGVPLLTTFSQPVELGVPWASAMDEPCVRAVREAAGKLGWRLGYIAPAPVALMRALEDPSFTWADGSIVVEVTRTGQAFGSVRTRMLGGVEPPPVSAHPVPSLSMLGEKAVRYGDAYGAAVMESAPPLGLDPRAAGSWSPKEVRARLLLPALLLALGIISFVLSPLAAVRAESRARTRLAAVRADQKQALVTTLARLESVSRILDGVHRFTDSRSLVTPTLGNLAQWLPDGCILESVELSDDQGTLVALSPDPAGVRAAVERLPGARSVELVGSLRREAVVGREVQRVTLRWRRGPS